MAVIDTHAHYYPTPYLDIVDRLIEGSDTHRARSGGATDDPGAIAHRLDEMEAAGVDLQIMSISTVVPYAESASAAIAAARSANDCYAELISQHPASFRAFASLPLPHIDPALEELSHSLDELALSGVTIGTSVLGRALSDPIFEPVFREINERHGILFVHPSGVGACSPLVPSTGIGPPIEDTMAVWHLIESGFARRFPQIRIIVSHAGGAMPLLLDRLDQHYRAIRVNSDEPPSLTARKLWYDTVTHGSVAALRCAVKAFGAERLVMGSDFPYSSYERSVTYISECKLSSEELEAIQGGTVASMIGY